MIKKFRIKPEIYFGEKAVESLKEMCLERVMVIADPFMVESGKVRIATDILDECMIPYTVFSDIVPNVPISRVASGMRVMLDFKPTAVLAVGGGSAIDTAKAIRYISAKVDSKLKDSKLIAVPTTSGTGSEATSHAVILDEYANVKNSLSHEDMIPDIAILDVDFVKSVPSGIAADTGLDVLVHAMEAYVSTNASDLTDVIALKAIKDVFDYLPKVVLENDTYARYKMHIASSLAGMAFENAGLGITHSLAHILGAKYKIPHGKANGILLPYIMKYNGENGDKTKYLKLADELGVPGFSPELKFKNLVSKVEALRGRIGVEANIAQTGAEDYTKNPQMVREMAEIAIEDQCTPTNPAKPTVEDLERLMVTAYVGDERRY